MKIYEVHAYNRMEDYYDKWLYVDKENANKKVEEIIRNWNEGKSCCYKSAFIEVVKTED